VDNVKIILTAGNILQLMEKYKRRLYFDQSQKLIQKLNITALPTRVGQEGRSLYAEQIALP
jgi:hypothetical protein